ncbi:MAG: trigger factor [Dehalococcoidia bacterium]
MKISTEQLPENQVRLAIEVEPERVEKSMDKAYRRLVGKYRIPGFRPGKAPRIMFERYIGREALMREALEGLVPEVYEEADKEESLDPIGQPNFEIDTLEPLLIKATVPLRPQVNLGDYRERQLPRDEVTVDPDAVDASIEGLRKSYATLLPVERPVQTGDVTRADLKAEVDGEELLNETDVELRVTPENLKGLPGLAERLVGAEKEGSYDYEVDVPEEYDQSALAGKRATYHVTIREVKEEILPALDDAFASEVGEGFPSLAALRERIESDHRRTAQAEADREYELKVLEAIIAGGQLLYPPVLVDREVDHIINEESGAGRGRAGIDAMLRRVGRTEEQFREDLRPAAVERVQRSLVLTQLAEQEGINVEPSDVEAELDRLSSPAPAAGGGKSLRELFSSDSGKEYIERTLLTRKVYDRLREIGEGKDLPPQAVASLPLISIAESAGDDTDSEAPAVEPEDTAPETPAERPAEATVSETVEG